MLYKCEHCDYTTKRIRDLRRHNDRKTPCYKENKEDVCNLEVNDLVRGNNDLVRGNNDLVRVDNDLVRVDNDLVRVDNDLVRVDNDLILENPKVKESQETIEKDKRFICNKCNKILSSNQQLKLHCEKCRGLHPLQCPICLKMFASKQGKHEHKKYVKCSPPIQHNNNTTNNYNNCHNTNNNTYNINILRTDFDKITKEDIENMVSRIAKEEYLNMVNKNIDIGKYVIPRTMKHIYFNDDFPELQVLKKERRNDKMVEVYVGEGKWEKRMMNDVCRDVISQVENFHTEYLRYIEEKYKDVKIGSAKWKQLMRPIKTFGNTMLWYNGFRGDEIESIGVELNYPDDDDEETERERDRKNKEMEKLVGEKVYDESKIIERATQIMLGQNKSSLI